MKDIKELRKMMTEEQKRLSDELELKTRWEELSVRCRKAKKNSRPKPMTAERLQEFADKMKKEPPNFEKVSYGESYRKMILKEDWE